MSDLEREWEESEEKRLTDENVALRAELDRLRAGLARLESAADPFMADQSSAPDPRCGNVQPITVAEGIELTGAVRHARELLAAPAKGGK
jgi:hypothetical protein